MTPPSFSTAGGVGDLLCLVSAARTYARLTGYPTYVEHLPDVVRQYGDDLLRFGRCENNRYIDVARFHRQKEPAGLGNYLGIFLHALLPDLPLPHPFELPTYPPEPARVLIQPKSNFARNPDPSLVQRWADQAREQYGPLYVIGAPWTERFLTGVDYSLLEDSVSATIGHLQSASHVLTPRSFSAHVAAAYHRPTTMWLPNDGENWHMDYPDWPHQRILFENDRASHSPGPLIA